MNRVLRDVYGNPSSLHGAARLAASIIEDSRRQVAEAIACSATEVCFTGIASEANNTVLKPETCILDVRFSYDRKSLPKAHEASFSSFRRSAPLVPKHRNVSVVCQAGVGAPVVAYYLRAKGHRNVSFLLTWMTGWRMRHPALYDSHAGRDVVELRAGETPRLQTGEALSGASKEQQ
jgi:rhodanese-related sulfurtransferase